MSKIKVKSPLSEVVDVLDSQPIYKTENWWCAVVKGKMFGKENIFYL